MRFDDDECGDTYPNASDLYDLYAHRPIPRRLPRIDMLAVVLMPDRMAPTPESDAQGRMDAKVLAGQSSDCWSERLWLGSQEQPDGSFGVTASWGGFS